MWPDIYGMTAVAIALPPGGIIKTGPLSFLSDEKGDDSRPCFSVELPRRVWRAGEALTGRIGLVSSASRRIRRAVVTLARVERSSAGDELESDAVHVARAELPGGSLGALGATFSLPIPSDAVPSFTGLYSRLEGVLVELDVALGPDVRGAEFITIGGGARS
ncbi:MAG: hypothetical protein ACUVV6_05715 [Thermoplasmatota archaeon]